VDLEKPATLCGYGGHEVGASFLRSESHLGSIKEGPGLKPPKFRALIRGLKAPAPSGKTGMIRKL
jgi:hypothetical protein